MVAPCCRFQSCIFQGADRNRRIGRPESGGADFGNLRANRLGHQRQADDIADLAAVGRHAERGVALQMLDRDKTLAMRQAHVVSSDIVLRVDDGFGFAPLDAYLVNRLDRV
jgi:hypothetical protein